MESTTSANGVQQSQETPNKGEDQQTNYMQFFRELSAKEAQQLTQRIRIDSDLLAYINKVLYAVKEGGKILVPHDFPMPQKSLKAAIKKVSRGLEIPVRFDKAVGGGFIVRQASVDEQVQGDRTGERLGATRKKK